MSARDPFPCWRCGAEIGIELLPLRREEVCPACAADVHVCRQCEFYNPSVSDACDEPVAQTVTRKDRANFCDYFKASMRAYQGGDGAGQTDRAKAELNALFGDTSEAALPGGTSTANEQALNDLFGLND